MILFLHNRYRTTGGEERVVDDLMWLVQEHLGERAQLIGRDSARLRRAQAAAALIAGGAAPREVEAAVRDTGARVLHAHNLHPSFGWRALAAGRRAGAKVVLHLHQYRLVCAVGVCFTAGEQCTRCHARNTLPGLRRNCRGSHAEALAYGAALALWQRRTVEQADAIVVPSEFALRRLRELGAPLPWERTHVLPPPVRALDGSSRGGADPAAPAPAGRVAAAAAGPPAAAPADRPAAASAGRQGGYALVVSRLAPEKGVDVAIDACAAARLPLVIAGDGPERQALQRRAQAAGGSVTFAGEVSDGQLERLRAEAAIALVPSRTAETFGAAAAEAMAAGLPVLASEIGALPELVAPEGLVPPGDASALAEAMRRLWGDAEAGRRGHERVAASCSPQAVAAALAEVYRVACDA